MKRLYKITAWVMLSLLAIAIPAIALNTEQILNSVYDSTNSALTFQLGGWTDDLDVSDVTALTNTVHPIITMTHNTTGTEANGIGMGLRFTQEVTSGNEIGGYFNLFAEDVTSGAEDFGFEWLLMKAGAAASQAMNLTSLGVLHLINDATLDNSTNGTLTITEPAIGLVGATSITGATDITGALTVVDATEATGGLVLNTTTATSGALTGATDKIEVDIPSGALLVACSLNVDVAVTNAGDNTWAAAYSGGATAEICAAATAAAKNTKCNAFFDANAATAIASAETDITLTPQGADFTAGDIRAVCYYYTLTSLGDEA